MSLTVPFRLHRHPTADEDDSATKRAADVEDLASEHQVAERSRSPVRLSPPLSDDDGGPSGAAGQTHHEEPARDAAVRLGQGTAVRVGVIGLKSASVYLLLWAVVLFLLQVLVFWAVHATLHRMGVLDSVSEAAATVLGDPVPASGVLPALEMSALLPWVLLVAGVLAVLALIAALSIVLVHNCICALTPGPQVRLR